MSVRFGYLGEVMPAISLDVPVGRYSDVMEETIEKAIVRYLGEWPRRVVSRQVECHGYKPDILIVSHPGSLLGPTVTVVEVKREIIGARAVVQIDAYVSHFASHLVDDDARWTIYGILTAPSIRPGVRRALPSWCGYQPLDVHVRRAA